MPRQWFVIGIAMLARAGAGISAMSQPQFAAYVRADFEKWRAIAREADSVVE